MHQSSHIVVLTERKQESEVSEKNAIAPGGIYNTLAPATVIILRVLEADPIVATLFNCHHLLRLAPRQ